jgi:DNA-binding transcriptional ArsR family regulator
LSRFEPRRVALWESSWECLSHGERVCDLAWITGRAENLVSQHLRELRVVGVAEARRDGKMVLYSVTPLGRELLSAAPAHEARA